MDRSARTGSRIFNGLEPAYRGLLKPLSLFSRMIMSDQEASLHQICHPFMNFKFETVNDCPKKFRKLEDFGVDVYETPDVSPDIGCFMNHCRPIVGQDSAIKMEMKQTGGIQHVKGSSEQEMVIPNVARSFEGNIDNILSLNQLDACRFCQPVQVHPQPPQVSSSPFREIVEVQLEEVLQGCKTEPTSKSQDMVSDGEDSTVVTGFQTTLPLQVQVKSHVVVTHQPPVCGEHPTGPLTAQPPNQNTKEPSFSQTTKQTISARSRRPVFFDRELERNKRMYIHSVTRHMDENPAAIQDAITELHNLIASVADTSNNCMQWQHPSDLTRRNYKRHCGNMLPPVALREWQAKNSPARKRFAKVPITFRRSLNP